MSRKNLLSLILTIAGLWSTVALGQKAQTPVEKHGFLRVEGNRIVDQHGQVVQLRGMSYAGLSGSQSITIMKPSSGYAMTGDVI